MLIIWKLILFVVAIILMPLSGLGVETEPLIETQVSWDGSAFQYPGGRAQVTAIKLKLEEGEATPFHCHPVPTFGYVLRGAVEVETKSGEKMVFSEGQAAVEVMSKVHRGRAVKGPLEILVFYAGSEGVPNTISDELCGM